MLDNIMFAFWFLLPAACANVTPIVAAKLPYLRGWNTPLDFGRRYRGKPVFGPHKTWRGLITGMAFATLILAVQKFILAHYDWQVPAALGVSYDEIPLLLVGPLLGFGALAGDALESFCKRQRGIESGKAWVPFDQLDYIIGAVLVSLLVARVPLVVYGWMFVIYFGLHFVMTYIGWLLKFKERPL